MMASHLPQLTDSSSRQRSLSRRQSNEIVVVAWLYRYGIVLAALHVCMHRIAVVLALTTGPVPPTSYSLFDRFRPVINPGSGSILQFDPSLVTAFENEAKVDQSAESPSSSSLSSSSSSSSSSIWVAVYRSSNNMPSVLVRNEFTQAMQSATTMSSSAYAVSTTTGSSATTSSSSITKQHQSYIETFNGFDVSTTSVAGRSLIIPNKPVAIARLRQSPDYHETYIMDMIRCLLRKEDVDDTCDGGSEHLEALSTAIDTLLLHYLQLASLSSSSSSSTRADTDYNRNHSNTRFPNPSRFDGAIRVKATLYSSLLLEARGFQPVDSLPRDFATHVSSLDGCLNCYAARSVRLSTNEWHYRNNIHSNNNDNDNDSQCSHHESNNNQIFLPCGPAARQRALEIVSYLGRWNRRDDMQAIRDDDIDCMNNNGPYDPWANAKWMI